jgi:DNA-directed RNA polymerase specialized sigma24 family protein
VRAQSGDAEALDALLGSIQDPLYLYILRLLGDHHLAYDILQNVFVLIIRKLLFSIVEGKKRQLHPIMDRRPSHRTLD